MPSDLILEGVIFQNFLRVFILTNPTSTMVTNMVVPLPFQKSRSVPANYCDYLYTLYGIVFLVLYKEYINTTSSQTTWWNNFRRRNNNKKIKLENSELLASKHAVRFLYTWGSYKCIVVIIYSYIVNQCFNSWRHVAMAVMHMQHSMTSFLSYY